MLMLGIGIADDPVFEDEVELDLEELEVRSASRYRKIYSAVDSMLPVPVMTVCPAVSGGMSTVTDGVEKDL